MLLPFKDRALRGKEGEKLKNKYSFDSADTYDGDSEPEIVAQKINKGAETSMIAHNKPKGSKKLNHVVNGPEVISSDGDDSTGSIEFKRKGKLQANCPRGDKKSKTESKARKEQWNWSQPKLDSSTTTEPNKSTIASKKLTTHDTKAQRKADALVETSTQASSLVRSSMNSTESPSTMPGAGNVSKADFVRMLAQNDSEFGDRVQKIKMLRALNDISFDKFRDFIPDSFHKDLLRVLRVCRLSLKASAADAATILAKIFLLLNKAVKFHVANGTPIHEAITTLMDIDAAVADLWKCGNTTKKQLVLKSPYKQRRWPGNVLDDSNQIPFPGRNRDPLLAAATAMISCHEQKEQKDKNISDHSKKEQGKNMRDEVNPRASKQAEGHVSSRQNLLENGVVPESLTEAHMRKRSTVPEGSEKERKRRRLNDEPSDQQQPVEGVNLEAMIVDTVKGILVDAKFSHNDKRIAGSVYGILKGPRCETRTLAKTFVLDFFRNRDSSNEKFDPKIFVFSIAYACGIFEGDNRKDAPFRLP
eukprot:scaffold63190_cov53-Attheya_sp.AAC.5